MAAVPAGGSCVGRLARRLQTRAAGVVLPAGLTVMAAGSAVMAVVAPSQLRGTLRLIPAAGFVLLLARGQMIAMPAARDRSPDAHSLTSNDSSVTGIANRRGPSTGLGLSRFSVH